MKAAAISHGYAHNKEQVLKRLSRAEGQVRGVARMVQEDTYCIDILTQINAAQAALDKVALELLRDHATHCLTNKNLSAEDTQKKADELVGAIGRMLSR
jgi:CsoR family transcriptional regulator, copper-sensing transcriptional repressor